MDPTRNMHQVATVWETRPNGFGGYLFSEPFLTQCRWEDRSELYYGRASGKEEVSRAVVFLNCDVAVGDWIALGDHLDKADPSVIPGAFPVRDFSSIPNLRNLTKIRKARL